MDETVEHINKLTREKSIKKIKGRLYSPILWDVEDIIEKVKDLEGRLKRLEEDKGYSKDN